MKEIRKVKVLLIEWINFLLQLLGKCKKSWKDLQHNLDWVEMKHMKTKISENKNIINMDNNNNKYRSKERMKLIKPNLDLILKVNGNTMFRNMNLRNKENYRIGSLKVMIKKKISTFSQQNQNNQTKFILNQILNNK